MSETAVVPSVLFLSYIDCGGGGWAVMIQCEESEDAPCTVLRLTRIMTITQERLAFTTLFSSRRVLS